MAGVEDAIVEMKFDNAAFEAKLSETIRSLDKLRASLDFSNAKKGMQDLSTAGKNFNMNSMGQGIEDISRKFLAMSTIAITALANITSHAVTAGLALVKSFTFGPIQAGFQEMETNMNSIQTILANTKSDGSTLEDVNGALAKLNEYSDKTIYNFSQMARNIGTFTAAGVNLDDSVNAIKGIANLAAISGSNSEQASTAMYQLSQALAAGKVNLMDWNSVVNAGMGGEVFKKALFETGKALGEIKDVPLGASFEEWEKKGGTFREQMQKGWLTADVLKTTLGAFSGDLDAAALSAMGFSDAAAQEMVDLGDLGIAAATEVKTMTQLVGTVKESIASGWSKTFMTVIGDFGEAKKLFTEINAFLGGIIGKSADYRNNLLAAWKFFGGRDTLIKGFKDGIAAIGNVLGAVQKAFRTFFPKKTAVDLLNATNAFADFTARLKELTEKWIPKITHLFKGLFAGLQIVWEVLKNVGKLILGLFSSLAGVAGGPIIGFFTDLATNVINLNKTLVGGGGIAKFFQNLSAFIRAPIEQLKEFKKAVEDFFAAFKSGDGAGDALGRVTDRFGPLGDAFDWLIEKTEGVRQALGDLWNYITQWFRELGDSMKSEMEQGDFEGALDIFNVAFLGGIALMLRKFFKGGFKIPGGGGFVDKIKNMFDELTGTLKAMQTELKSKALLNIAIALGVLTLSLVALSLIDSADLTKALLAMSVGFGELVAAMLAIDAALTTMGAAKFAIAAGGMILIAAAMLVLAAAMKVIATMSWEEIAKGLAGVGGGLAILVTGMNFITADTAGLVKAGLSIIFISAGLLVLAKAMQAFATMGWSEIGKGMAAVAGGMVILVKSLNTLDAKDMISAGLGIIGISTGMLIMSQALQEFATMSWEDLAKGLGAVIIALGAIVLLTNTMPIGGMVGIGAGLILVAGAMNVMAQAIQTLGAMDFGELAKGVGAIAAMMLILVVATNAMTGALAGAAAMVVVAGALFVLTEVISTLGGMGITELVTGMVALVAIFAILGGAAFLLEAVLVPLIGLGVALALIGIGMAAFGAGAYLVIKAFDLLGKTGKKSMLALIDIIAIFVARAPLIGIAIASVLVAAVTDLAEAAPALIKALKVVLLELLEAIIELVPKILEVVEVLTDEIIELMLDKSPDMIQAGITLILNFMKGIRDNIEEFINVGSEIIVQFLLGISQNDDKIIDTAVEALESFLNAIAGAADDIALAGYNMLITFLEGLVSGIEEIIEAAVQIVIGFAQAIVDNALLIVDAGVQMIQQLLLGIAQGALQVAQTVTNIIVSFITAIGSHYLEILNAGGKMVLDLLYGVGTKAIEIANAVGWIISQFILAVGANAQLIIDSGVSMIVSFITGIGQNIQDVVDAGVTTILKFIEGVADSSLELAQGAADALVDFLVGLEQAIRDNDDRIMRAGAGVGDAIVDGVLEGLSNGAEAIKDKLLDIAGNAWEGVKSFFGITSPSKLFMTLGKHIMEGWGVGIDENGNVVDREISAVNGRVMTALEESIAKIPSMLGNLDEFNPVITPVIDLTKVTAGAKDIDKMMATAKIGADVSIDRARALSVVSNRQNGSEDAPVQAVSTEITYNQTINSPQPLSANDVYRASKSQIAVLKEELKIA